MSFFSTSSSAMPTSSSSLPSSSSPSPSPSPSPSLLPSVLRSLLSPSSCAGSYAEGRGGQFSKTPHYSYHQHHHHSHHHHINSLCTIYHHNHHHWHLWTLSMRMRFDSFCHQWTIIYITQAHKCTKMVKILWWKAKIGEVSTFSQSKDLYNLLEYFGVWST